MWVKDCSNISKQLPKDNKYHDIQIVDNNLYVDGELKLKGMSLEKGVQDFDGKIKKVQIYNKALTTEELKI